MRKSAQHEANQKINQEGFTLIELILSIAILSVVGLAIFGFMTTSSRIYGREVTQTDLQYQSQLVINQLQDLLIDASQSITYTVTAGGTATEVTSDTGIDEATVTLKEICIYNKDDYYRITWNRAEERLYYTRYTGSAPVGPGAPGSWTVDPSANRVRMADYVREFSADLTSLQKNRSVMFRFLFAVNDVSYATQHNITLRNQVVKGEGEVGTPTVIAPKQDGIKIQPTTIMVWPGDSVVFVHTITSKTGGYPSQAADYSLSVPNPVEASAADTQIGSNGELRVGMKEKNADLKVTVTAKEGAEQEDGSIYRPEASASVQVKQVKGLTVELTKGGTYTGATDQRLIAGSTLQFKVSTLVGDHITVEDLKATGVSITWGMEKGAEYASVDANGLLTVSGVAPKGAVFQVKATFNRAEREWAYGYSTEYSVVTLKGGGLIYEDEGNGEYIAPEGEIWFPEAKKISINWDKLGDEWKSGLNSDYLTQGYYFDWKITLLMNGVWRERNDLQGLFVDKSIDKWSKDASVVLDLKAWMQWNIGYDTVEAIKIELEIYNRYGYWLKTFDDAAIILEIPRVEFRYSCTEGRGYVEELPLYVTREVGEVYLFFFKQGDASTEVRYWEQFDNPDVGWYRLTNKENFLNKYESEYGGGNLQLDTRRKPRTIYFTPNASIGSSVIRHHTCTGEIYEDTRVVVYFRKPNVQKEVYYVPLPNDPAYRDNGYLFGDCSFTVTTEKQPGGGSYYKLIITDNRENVKKEITAYCESGDKEWKNTVPMP